MAFRRALGPCRAELQPPPPGGGRKRVVVVGAGWAGLASAHHLSKQGYQVTLLEAASVPTEEVGTRGFWHPYRNIFSLVQEIGLDPFTKWTKAAYYSPEGVVVEFPIFQDQPRLPAPLGALAYPQFSSLSLLDRLTTLPVMAAVIDFDNTDSAWRKYDTLTARELFKQYGCSQELYNDFLEAALQVGLFAPGEQCSAATALGMLNYYVFSHQQNFDFLLCRGEVGEKILSPWLDLLEQQGLRFLANRVPTDFTIDNDTGYLLGVQCGSRIYEAEAFVLALGISAVQSLVLTSPVLQSRQEFLNVLNLATIDVISVKLWFDRKVNVPKAANLCYGFEDLAGWAFFDVTTFDEEPTDESATIIEAEFYNSSNWMPLNDEQIVKNVKPNLAKCIQGFAEAGIKRHTVVKRPKTATHFFPGSYKYMMKGSTTFPNLFMAGNWIINRHGSFSKEKAYVTGLEAANRVVDYFGDGNFAKIIAVEEEEPHVEALRDLNRRAYELRSQIPFADFFLQ